MSTQLLKREDLIPGDIILFSPYDDWESKLIAKMTESKVTHSAMSYYTNLDIVEEIPPYAKVSAIKDRIEERTIYVMRFKPTDTDLTSVLDISKQYVEEKAPYSKVNLIFIGLYMLIKKEFLSHTEQKLLTKLLKLVTADIIDLINKNVMGYKHPFVCSQFIFNCYYTAGDKYTLKIKNDLKSKSILRQILNNESIVKVRNREVDKIDIYTKDIEVEKILESLYHECNQNEFKHVSSEIQNELSDAVYDFSLVYHKLFTAELAENEHPLSKLLEIEELFVTPGDLHKNMENLYQVGILDNDEAKE